MVEILQEKEQQNERENTKSQEKIMGESDGRKNFNTGSAQPATMTSMRNYSTRVIRTLSTSALSTSSHVISPALILAAYS